MSNYKDFHGVLTRESYNDFQAMVKTKIIMGAKEKEKI